MLKVLDAVAAVIRASRWIFSVIPASGKENMAPKSNRVGEWRALISPVGILRIALSCYGGELHKRGISKEQIYVMTSINYYGDIFYEVACRGCMDTGTSKRVLRDRTIWDSIISTDKHNRCKAVLPTLDVVCRNAYDNKNRSRSTINRINNVHSRLHDFLKLFKGISTKYLNSYMTWFKWLCSLTARAERFETLRCARSPKVDTAPGGVSIS